jgi:hypothetical protein
MAIRVLYYLFKVLARRAFKQKDYLSQVLEHLQPILEAFAAVTHLLRPPAEPLFMEDGNSAHGHKSTRNCCARYRTAAWYCFNAAPFYKPWYEPNWEVLEEDQASIAQAPKATDYCGWNETSGHRRMGKDTTRMDKWVDFKAGALGSGANGAPWVVYS